MAAMRKCGRCGKRATGLASITTRSGETFYCHGDNDTEPTCYMKAQVMTPFILALGLDLPDDERATFIRSRTGT